MDIKTRVALIFILTITFFLIFHKKDRVRDKPAGYYTKRFLIIWLICFIPPALYFVLPDSVAFTFKFYLVFILSILILVGLLVYFIREKMKDE